MLRWLTRLMLFRILPHRLLPVLTLIEVVRMLRGARNQRRAADAEGGARVRR